MVPVVETGSYATMEFTYALRRLKRSVSIRTWRPT